jgi:hypothetical protein
MCSVLSPSHHDIFPVFESPTRAARFEHDRIAAEFVNPHLHRSARAQTGVKEDERD